MGAAASLTVNMSDERQFALYEQLKEEYERNKDNGKSPTENFMFYKRKYEAFVEASAHAERLVVYNVGDIVDCGTEDGGEGIIVDLTEDGKYRVDVGRKHLVDLPAVKLKLVLNGLEYEVGDKVQVRPVGSYTFFTGWVIAIHNSSTHSDQNHVTYDVKMAGDDDDIERGVAAYNMRKLLSHRLVRKKFKKIINTVMAGVKFSSPARNKSIDMGSDAKDGASGSRRINHSASANDTKLIPPDSKEGGEDSKYF